MKLKNILIIASVCINYHQWKTQCSLMRHITQHSRHENRHPYHQSYLMWYVICSIVPISFNIHIIFPTFSCFLGWGMTNENESWGNGLSKDNVIVNVLKISVWQLHKITRAFHSFMFWKLLFSCLNYEKCPFKSKVRCFFFFFFVVLYF